MTKTKTNWHYECARELARGNIAIGESEDAGFEGTWMVRKRKISDALIEFAESLKPSDDFGMPEKIPTKKEANHFFRWRHARPRSQNICGLELRQAYSDKVRGTEKRTSGKESGELNVMNCTNS